MRIAVLGDLDGAHTRRWLRVFIERGHDVHAVSFYPPRTPVSGVTLHVLRPAYRTGRPAAGAPASPSRALAGKGIERFVPPSAARLVHAFRYARAGLGRTVEAIGPDIFHAHYVVEHGFYGAFAGFHPYVVSAWGSDLFRAPGTPAGRLIAGYALRHADFVTANDPALARRAGSLGGDPEKVAVIRLGIDRLFLEPPPPSVNLRAAGADPLTVISDRALEPLYNVDAVIRAFARARRQMPSARLLVANDGSQRSRLEALARDLGQGESVRFLGRLDPPALREALAQAHVYVSVPSSDSLSLSTTEAMAAGCFPIVTDLESQDGWISHHVNGLRVPARDVGRLADGFVEALRDDGLRRDAVEPNRAKVAAEGGLEKNMLLMERHYYRLAGHPLADNAI